MTRSRNSCPMLRRRGFSMVEIAVASLLLAIAMTVTVQVLGWVAAERRVVDRRQCAVGEAANILERLTARPWEKLTPEAVKSLSLSEDAKRALPDGELTVALHESNQDRDARRIALRIRWRNRSGEWDAPVRLVAWTYRVRSER
jgi:prepilin-type N-terminal cleavage/methylation domain-containing protein